MTIVSKVKKNKKKERKSVCKRKKPTQDIPSYIPIRQNFSLLRIELIKIQYLMFYEWIQFKIMISYIVKGYMYSIHKFFMFNFYNIHFFLLFFIYFFFIFLLYYFGKKTYKQILLRYLLNRTHKTSQLAPSSTHW